MCSPTHRVSKFCTRGQLEIVIYHAIKYTSKTFESGRAVFLQMPSRNIYLTLLSIMRTSTPSTFYLTLHIRGNKMESHYPLGCIKQVIL